MAIKTRETTATGVTNKGAPLTNAELDNNFVELVADIADKVNTADLNESVDDRVNNLLQAGLGVDLTYDDINNELTIDSNHVEVNCTNNSGASIAIGTPVYQAGVSGNNITIAPADADDAAKMPAIGLTTSTIANGNEGTVVILGVVNGLDTSTFTAGDTVYVGTTAGTLTTTAPTGESGLIQNFGRVLKVNASSGSIAVMGAGRANAVPNLNDGNVFIGNASNQAETRALVEADISDFGTYLTAESDTLDSVTGRGATTSNSIQVGDATVTGNLTVQGTTTTLNTATLDVEDKNITINYSTGDSSGSADGAGITIQDAVNSTTDATILWDATGDKFEFSHAVDVAGNITLTGTVDGRDIATDGTKLDGIEASADVTDATNVAAAGAVMDGDFTANGFMKRTGAGTYTVDTNTYLTSYTETDTLDSVTGRGSTTTNAVTVGNLTSTGIDDNATSTAITIDSSANVGIGTTAPAARLDVIGGLIRAARGGGEADTSYGALQFTVDGTQHAMIASENSFNLKFITNTTERMRIDGSGNVGIGTSGPDAKLDVKASTATVEVAARFRKGSTADTGGHTTLIGLGTEDATWSKSAIGHQRNSQYDVGNLIFCLNNDNTSGADVSTSDERMRIDSSGNLLVGTTTAGLSAAGRGLVEVSGSSTAFVNLKTGTTNRAYFAVSATATEILSQTNPLLFNVNAAERMRLDSAGDLGINITNPTEKLHVGGNILASGNITAYSDERLKSDVETLDGSKVYEMRGVSFTKDGEAGSGVIAQELQKVAPELVNDSGEYLSVAYGNLVGYLIEAVKELKAEIEELKNASSD